MFKSIALFLALAITGCAGTQKPSPTVKVVVNCGVPEVAKLVVTVILPAVEAALKKGDWNTALSDMETALKAQGITDVVGLVACAELQLETTRARARARVWIMAKESAVVK
jgi:hypothetical protein